MRGACCGGSRCARSCSSLEKERAHLVLGYLGATVKGAVDVHVADDAHGEVRRVQRDPLERAQVRLGDRLDRRRLAQGVEPVRVERVERPFA